MEEIRRRIIRVHRHPLNCQSGFKQEIRLLCLSIECGAIQYSMISYSIVQYSIVQYSIVQYSIVQYSIVQYSIVQQCIVWYNIVQYSIVQYSIVQYIIVNITGPTRKYTIHFATETIQPLSQQSAQLQNITGLPNCQGVEFPGPPMRRSPVRIN